MSYSGAFGFDASSDSSYSDNKGKGKKKKSKSSSEISDSSDDSNEYQDSSFSSGSGEYIDDDELELYPLNQNCGQRYDVIRLLGQGTYGKVFLVLDKEDQEEKDKLYAMKYFEIKDETMFVNELYDSVLNSYLTELECDVPKIKSSTMCESGTRFATIMEYIHGKSLRNYTRNKGYYGRFNVKLKLLLTREILLAFDCLIRNGVYHSDIKADNIMVDESTSRPQVVVIDFGLSKVSNRAIHGFTQFATRNIKKQYINGLIDRSRITYWTGSALYQPPEYFLQTKNLAMQTNPKNLGLKESFSLGQTLFELWEYDGASIANHDFYKEVKVAEDLRKLYAQTLEANGDFPTISNSRCPEWVKLLVSDLTRLRQIQRADIGFVIRKFRTYLMDLNILVLGKEDVISKFTNKVGTKNRINLPDTQLVDINPEFSSDLEMILSACKHQFYESGSKGAAWRNMIGQYNYTNIIILTSSDPKEPDYIYDIQEFLNTVKPELRKLICIVDITKKKEFDGKFPECMYFRYKSTELKDLFRRMYDRYSMYNFLFPEKIYNY